MDIESVERLGATALLNPPEKRTLGVILAVEASQPEVEANLQCILRTLEPTDIDRIVVAEQHDPARPTLCLPEHVDHRVRSMVGPIRRSQLVNEVARSLEVDRLWIHDPNLLLPFTTIVPQIRRCPRAVLKPFSWFAKLSAKASESTRHQDAISPSDLENVKRLGETIGKSSFVIDRALFLAVGGLSEAFFGAGDEGFELLRRLRVHLKHLPALDAIGVQLFVPSSIEDTTAKEANRKLKDRLAPRIDHNLHDYLTQHLETQLTPDPQRFMQLCASDERERTLRPSAPHPPSQQPAPLPGELWALACYFNPVGYQSKHHNFQKFCDGLREAQIPLLVVELAFADAPFVVEPHEVQALVQLRTNEAGLLWQKERLLNLGIRALPPSCDKVAWLDADILFARPDWGEAMAAALERYPVIQGFSLSVRLQPGQTQVDVRDLPLGASEHEILHSIAYGHAAHGPTCLNRYLLHGHSGYAWAARRSVLERHGLYDRNILGNADLNIAHALFGGGRAIRADRLSTAAQQDIQQWADRIYKNVNGSVGWIDGLIYHLWHGSKRHRRYHERLDVLIEANFEPTKDLELDSQGLYRWTGQKPRLQQWCAEYFHTRREDGE